MVEYLPSKQGTRVRFPYAAQNEKKSDSCPAFSYFSASRKGIEQGKGSGKREFSRGGKQDEVR